MKSSEACIELIKEFEGFRSAPYLCPAGKATIGFGSTYNEDGSPVTMDDEPISEETAEDLLRVTLLQYEDAVNAMVKVEMTQGQFDALVDFAYNAGSKALRNSTLLKFLNGGNYAAAANEFDKWVNGGGRRLPGLVRRRAAERALFEA